MYYAKHDKFIIEDNQVHTTDFLPLKKKYKNMEFLGIFKEIVTMFEIDTYMELGVRKGYTFNNIAPLVKSAVAVDIGDMKNIIELPNVTKIQMRTDDLALKWNEPIDFLFIDADHRKEQAMRDFDNFSKFVRIGTGIIAMHDTHPIDQRLLSDDNCSSVWQVADEISRRTKDYYNKFEIFTFPGPFAGLSLIRKRRHHLAWGAVSGDDWNK
jgi:hypothetical protein